jgi:hypothetical protein
MSLVPAPAPSAVASSLNCPLCVTRNAAILGRFVFRRRGRGRRRGRNFCRRIIGADVTQRCYTRRLNNLRVCDGFVYGRTQASLGGCRQCVRRDRRLAGRDINER